MTQQQSYSYVTLRYVHDAMTGEFLNVGLLLFAPSDKTLLARTRKTISRVRDAFPDLDRSAYTKAMNSIERSVSHLGKDLFRAPLLSREMDAAHIAHRVLPPDDSSFQWSPAGVGRSANIDQTFERLFSRLVGRYDEPGAHRKSDDEVWRPVCQMLEQRDLLQASREDHRWQCGSDILQARLEEWPMAHCRAHLP